MSAVLARLLVRSFHRNIHLREDRPFAMPAVRCPVAEQEETHDEVRHAFEFILIA